MNAQQVKIARAISTCHTQATMASEIAKIFCEDKNFNPLEFLKTVFGNSVDYEISKLMLTQEV
jgi:hypothetical protein